MDLAMNNKLPVSTVGYLIRETDGREELLLGEKVATPKAIKRKIAGKLLSYGGDFESDVDISIRHCFARELAEESDFRIDPADAEVTARVLIKGEKGDILTLYYVFVRRWQGDAGSSDEILNPRWFPANPLPENVLGADKIILPRLFEGEKLEGWLRYDADMNVVSYELKPVKYIDEALP